MNTDKIIGFWGYPNPEIVKKYKEIYPNIEFVDFDIDYGFEKQDVLPESYCAIMKNIINGAFHYRNNLVAILAPVGKDKCDSAWFTSEILKDMGFPVITTTFEDTSCKNSIVISTSELPLKQKVELITKQIINNEIIKKCERSNPKFGFWGVPPNDLSILEMFPDNTHVYGWLRCVEAHVPADIKLEMYVDKDVPTVFYSQSFCAKSQMAKYLADKYDGLYIDIDDKATNSTKAKLEAFLRLR